MTISEMGIGDTIGGTANYGPYSIELELEKVEDGFMIVSKGVSKRRKNITDLKVAGKIVNGVHERAFDLKNAYGLGTVLNEKQVEDIVT